MNRKSLSISNIAWNPEIDEKVASILSKHDLKYIDIAPSKYFKNFHTTTLTEVQELKVWWKKRNVDIYGFQSLLYGVGDKNIFRSEEDRSFLKKHLEKVFWIAQNLGARFLTFGSPKNRDVKGLSQCEVNDISYDFFWEIGELASTYGVVFCVEPNPEQYGANFLTSTQSAYEFVKKLNHKNVRMQLDSGTILLNEESMDFQNFKDGVGHIHVSREFLRPIYDSPSEGLEKVIDALAPLAAPVLTIEMLHNEKISVLEQIDLSISFLSECLENA